MPQRFVVRYLQLVMREAAAGAPLGVVLHRLSAHHGAQRAGGGAGEDLLGLLRACCIIAEAAKVHSQRRPAQVLGAACRNAGPCQGLLCAPVRPFSREERLITASATSHVAFRLVRFERRSEIKTSRLRCALRCCSGALPPHHRHNQAAIIPARRRTFLAGWLNHVRTCSCHFFLKWLLGTALLCPTIFLGSVCALQRQRQRGNAQGWRIDLRHPVPSAGASIVEHCHPAAMRTAFACRSRATAGQLSAGPDRRRMREEGHWRGCVAWRWHGSHLCHTEQLPRSKKKRQGEAKTGSLLGRPGDGAHTPTKHLRQASVPNSCVKLLLVVRAQPAGVSLRSCFRP